MRMNRTKKFAAVVAVAALGFGMAACGDDDDTSSTPDDAIEDITDGDGTAGDLTIVDLAVDAGEFTFLVTALELAGLVETLSGDGPYTVLAPTDDAFLALAQDLIGPDATLDDLAAALTEDEELLSYVLLSHVIAGSVLAADTVALDGQEVETLSGETLTISSDGSTVTFTTGGVTVTVVNADIVGSNGVIHVLDSVIIPAAQQS
jgi:transforming growth factor-beta-induced protein